ncbi:MAG: DNA-3-methyladenine glycosylase family protein [Rubripirellula sp.]
MKYASLDKGKLLTAVERLSEVDPHMRRVADQHGPPPLWKRPATFGTLVHVVLEQQVSLDSAKATFDRLSVVCDGRVSADRVEKLGDSGLREIGFTRQKSRYVSALADDVVSGRFRVGSLRHASDGEVRRRIKSRLGLGDWTADVFLLMALTRPDVLPTGDLALVKGMRELDGGDYANADQVSSRAEAWRPYRSVATRMIWQLYLANRNRLEKFSG